MNDEHTSYLKSFKPCSLCNYGFITQDNKVKKCQCRIDYEKDTRLAMHFLQANILVPSSSRSIFDFYKFYNIDNDYKGPDEGGSIIKVKKYIREFSSKFSSQNLFFTGTPGTQKTTIAKYIIKEIIKDGDFTGYYILANDLIETIIDATREPEKDLLIQRIIDSDILVIDEMDNDKIILYRTNEGQWQKSHFLPFLKKRLEVIKKSTIFISNKEPSNLGEQFQGSIQDTIERETLGNVLFFNDKYNFYKPKIDLKSIWDD